MYYCQATKKLSQPNEPAHKLVTHVRSKTYYAWDRKRQDYVAVGQGTEIVREILVSKEYHAQKMAEGFQPQLVKEKQ